MAKPESINIMKSKLPLFIKNWIKALIYPRPLIGIFFLHKFVRDFLIYSKMATSEKVYLSDMHPCLSDRVVNTPFEPHYFFQGGWLARNILAFRPVSHVDIGSSVLTISVLSAYVPIVFVDYRPLNVNLPGLTTISGDILCLPFDSDSLSSVSSLHVVEHIGLGRYGDSLDPMGSSKAARELERVLKPQGRLFLSVPIGRPRVCFNAHRVFSPDGVLVLFPCLKLVDFSFVDDAGVYRKNEPLEAANNLDYGCGLYVFEKI